MKKYTLLFLLFLMQFALHAQQATQDQNPNLAFVENQGQIKTKEGAPRRDIDFSLQTGTMSLFIGKGQMHYQFMNRSLDSPEILKDKTSGSVSLVRSPISTRIAISRLDVSLLGANVNAVIVKEQVQSTYYNYYNTGKEHSDGFTHVKTFNKVTYKDIYPNIDWVLYTSGQTLKYDFVVRPGGKVSDIKMKYEGADVLKLEKDGSLQMTTLSGSLKEQPPYSYELHSKKEVASRFTLKNNLVTFKTEAYEGTLVIDPGVEWGTYVPGFGIGGIKKIHNGYFYVSGTTTSLSDIATTGAHQDTFAGGYNDAVLAKYDTFGRLQWATYYSGNGEGRRSTVGQELNTSSTADNFGHVYLCGTTTSKTGIATPGIFQDSAILPEHGAQNGFLAQFNTDGIRQWGTYYGRLRTGFNDVACDNKGFVYVCGYSDSVGWADLVTPGTQQSYPGNGNLNGGYLPEDGLLVKFDSIGRRQWATFIGGDGGERMYGVICDTENNVYIHGTTSSITGMTSPECFQDSIHMGGGGYVAKMDGMNGKRIWGTYIDGMLSGFVLDAFNHLYLGGMVTDFFQKYNIPTPGTYMPEFAGHIFLMQFNPTTGLRNWGTYYGVKQGIQTGAQADGGLVACDLNANVYLTGSTNASDANLSNYSIATRGSHQDTLNSIDPIYPTFDAFVVQFDSTGNRKWGTYYGGTNHEISGGIACDDFGNLYLCGYTTSDSNVATPLGLHQERNNSSSFLVRFKPLDISLNGRILPKMDTVCTGKIPLDVAISNLGKMDKNDSLGISYVFTGPDNGNGAAFFVNGLKSGLTDTFNLDLNLTLPGVYDFTVYLHYTRDDENTDNDTLSFSLVVIDADPNADIDAYHVGTVFHFRNKKPKAIDRYFWDFGDGTTSTEAEPTHEYPTTKNYTVTLILSNICGSDTATTLVAGIGTDIENLNFDEYLFLYPNPASQYLYLVPQRGIELEAYTIENILGQTISSGELSVGIPIDIRNLAPGSYFIKLLSNKGWISKQFQRIP